MIQSDFLSFDEAAGRHGVFKEKLMLDKRLIFGYHQTMTSDNKRLRLLDAKTVLGFQNLLRSGVENALFEISPDLNRLSSARKWSVIKRILLVLALKIGQEVSYRYIGTQVGADHKTVCLYMGQLEGLGIIFRLPSFSKGFAGEKSNGMKFYFFDCGLRNAMIENFQPPQLRNDWDALWENFVIAERYKYRKTRRVEAKPYFWRNFNRQQIDLIEEKQGRVYAYIIRWSEKPRSHFQWPDRFSRYYPDAISQVLQPANLEKFIARKTLPYEIAL